MRVLFVINSLGIGGAERIVVDTADFLIENGHDVAIAYLHGPALIKPRRDDVLLFELKFEKKLVSIFSGLTQFLQILWCYKPDILHAHLFYSIIMCRLMRVFYWSNALISSYHNVVPQSKLKRFFCGATLFLSSIDTNVSYDAVQSYITARASSARKMRLVYNGIDIEKFKFDNKRRKVKRSELGCDENCILLLSVGSLTRQKDHRTLLSAAGELKRLGLNFRLVIAGDGQLRGDLEDQIDKLSLQAEVLLIGRCQDISSLMSAADIFVLPSLWEGFGLVVAEAMACSCLVISSDLKCVREVLGDNGFFIEPGNYQKLVSKIVEAVNLPRSVKQTYLDSARLRVEQNFSHLDMMETYLSIYNDKLKG